MPVLTQGWFFILWSFRGYMDIVNVPSQRKPHSPLPFDMIVETHQKTIFCKRFPGWGGNTHL